MASDYFLELDGIPGGATAKGMEGKMEVLSFSFGASNPSTVGSGNSGLAAGKVSVSTFNIMKKSEKASATLFFNSCNGKHIPKGTVYARKATGDGGQQVYLKYNFTDILVDSIQWSGSSGGDDTPTESLTLAFAKVEIEYQTQDNKGAVKKDASVSWDLTKTDK